MSSDGKQLESLVAFVEKTLLPPGFDVKSNERVFNDEGIQIAEFDIEIRGKMGTAAISWLIECRDRPGHGPAPGSWIEQLVGRRARFGFNKITAVSTTGFAAGAIAFAEEQKIELREVRSLAPAEFSDWLRITEMTRINRIAELKHATVFVHASESTEAKKDALETISRFDGNDQILESSLTSEMANFNEAFLGSILSTNGFDAVDGSRPLAVELRAQYDESDHYLLHIRHRKIRIEKIHFFGELRISEEKIPLLKTTEYRSLESGEVISQIATFEQQHILGTNATLEFRKMIDTGVTHVILNRSPSNKRP